jgi:hypothetical protein
MSSEDEQWIQQLRNGFLHPDFIKRIFDSQRHFRSKQLDMIETYLKTNPNDAVTQNFVSVMKGNLINSKITMEYLESMCLNIAMIGDLVLTISKSVRMQGTELEKIKQKKPTSELVEKIEKDAKDTTFNLYR